MAGASLNNIANSSMKFAKTLGAVRLETEHVLYGILCAQTSVSARLLSELGVDKDAYRKVMLTYLKNKNTTPSENVAISRPVSQIFAKTNQFLQKNGINSQESEYILYLILNNADFSASQILVNVFKIDI